MTCNKTKIKGKCVPRPVSQTGSIRGQVKGERSRLGQLRTQGCRVASKHS